MLPLELDGPLFTEPPRDPLDPLLEEPRFTDPPLDPEFLFGDALLLLLPRFKFLFLVVLPRFTSPFRGVLIVVLSELVPVLFGCLFNIASLDRVLVLPRSVDALVVWSGRRVGLVDNGFFAVALGL